MALHFICMWLVGAAFLGLSIMTPNAMQPEIYGEWAYDIDAEIWALMFMLASSLGLAGVATSPTRFMLTMKLVGVVSLQCLFLAIAVSAFTAPFGVPLWAFSLLYYSPVHLVYALIVLTEIRLLDEPAQ